MDDFAPVLDELTAYEPNVKDRLVGLLRKAANNLNPNLFPTNERKRELLEPAKSVIPEQSGPAQEALTTEMMMGAAAPGGLGGGVAGTLIGRGAKTFPHANLARALRNMHLNDQNNKGYAHEVGQDAIWKDTRIERVPRLNQYKDVDYWSEIPDNIKILNRKHPSEVDTYSGPMQGKVQWDELYNAYPKIADAPLDFYSGPGLKYGGSFWEKGDTGKFEIVSPTYEKARQALHHEAGGHGVAYQEDWQPGTAPETILREMGRKDPASAISTSSPTLAAKMYLKNYGEGVARLNEYRGAQARIGPDNNELIRPSSDLSWMDFPKDLTELMTKEDLANWLRNFKHK